MGQDSKGKEYSALDLPDGLVQNVRQPCVGLGRGSCIEAIYEFAQRNLGDI